MVYKKRTRDEHLANDGTPKRILTLDGGGLRGIFTVAILEKIEQILRERHGNDSEFRLCHYFDLIAGTSTGAIIAAALAIGWSVEEIREKYMSLGKSVFKKSLFRQGFFRAKYDEDKLIEELKLVYGKNTLLGNKKVETGLMIMAKRLDTGSPWPISNNPNGRYFKSKNKGKGNRTIGNGKYPLWKVVRASTAAPSYFEPETITIAKETGYQVTKGEFIDGGASPYNNPALQALMYATIDGYKIGWPTGKDKIMLVSLGTGTADPNVKTTGFTAKQAVKSLLSLMDDCAALQETMLQWMSSSTTARAIDSELGDLRHDLVAGSPLLTYLRYNTDLDIETVQKLDPNFTDKKKIKSLSEMDSPDNMETLYRLGQLVAKRDVKDNDFPNSFNLS